MRAFIIIGSSALLAVGYIWMTLSAQKKRQEAQPDPNTPTLTSSHQSFTLPTRAQNSADSQWDASRLPEMTKESAPLSPMANTLASADGSTEADLKALVEMFGYITLEDHGQIPTGTNAEITKALTTPNEYGISYLPRRHPAVSKDGEIIDRWSTPYFFHALSSEKMEIRSAGPDGQMYTDDDLVQPEKVKAPNRPQDYVQEIDLGL